MNLSVSEVIALFSLVVAFLAYKHSVSAAQKNARLVQEVASNQMKLTANIAMAQASKKYVVLLSEVARDFDGMVEQLSHVALEATKNIGNTFDRFDSQRHSIPYLRHALHTSTELVRAAYDQELSYQTGPNLAFRLVMLKGIKADAVAYEPSKRPTPLFSFLRQVQRTSSPEDALRDSPLFWHSVKTLYERIPEDRESALFVAVVAHIKAFVILHSQFREPLLALEKKLEEALKENALEMFRIHDVPGLGAEFKRVKGDLCRIKALYFPDLYRVEEFADQMPDGIANSVYITSILFIVSQRFMWGKL